MTRLAGASLLSGLPEASSSGAGFHTKRYRRTIWPESQSLISGGSCLPWGFQMDQNRIKRKRWKIGIAPIFHRTVRPGRFHMFLSIAKSRIFAFIVLKLAEGLSQSREDPGSLFQKRSPRNNRGPLVLGRCYKLRRHLPVAISCNFRRVPGPYGFFPNIVIDGRRQRFIRRIHVAWVRR